MFSLSFAFLKYTQSPGLFGTRQGTNQQRKHRRKQNPGDVREPAGEAAFHTSSSTWCAMSIQHSLPLGSLRLVPLLLDSGEQTANLRPTRQRGYLHSQKDSKRWESKIHKTVVTLVHAKLLQSCLTLCDPMDCSPPGPSVHGILQARILEWVAMPSSRGSSPPRDRTHIPYDSCIAGRLFTAEPLGKTHGHL